MTRHQRFRAFQEEVQERLQVLRAVVESLRTGAAGDQDSLLRIARSIRHAAVNHGLPEIRDLADDLQSAETLAERIAKAEVLLERVETGPAMSESREEKILVIEDEPVSAFLLESILSAKGRRVTVGRSAAEAERLVAEESFDLVILDLVLPDADGRDFLLKLRERPATAETPVIICSARPAAQARPECLALGAQDYLEKPVSRVIALAVVDRHLGGPAAPDREAVAFRGPGLANRATLSEAFAAAKAGDAQPGEPLSLASIAIDCPRETREGGGTRPEAGGSAEVLARIQAVLRPSDVLATGTHGRFLVLFPGTAPDEAARVLETAQSPTEPERRRDPPGVGESGAVVWAGVAEVSKWVNLGDAIARAERQLSRARSSGKQGVVLWEEEPVVAGTRVLLVEDDPVTARLIMHRLGKDDFDVVHFDDGLAAYEACAGERVALAIFDVKLPGIDGFELLQRVRGLPNFAETPILMLTSMGKEQDIVRGFELGASDYVLKPFSPVELVARVHRLLDG